VPAILETTSSKDAGANANQHFVARDCRGIPLPGIRVSLNKGSEAMTGTDGSVDIPDPSGDGGATNSPASARNPQISAPPSTCGGAP
jgi:hypothetical protein